MSHDWLIVGAGFTGATLAERLAGRGQKVLLIDRRSHIAGNAYDEVDENGILLHRYGPHIFHTNSRKVWDYLSQFTAWRPYEHEVLGRIDGKLVPIPFNLNTLDALYPAAEARALTEALVSGFGMETKVPILKLRQSSDSRIQALAGFIYEKVFLHYTRKQWGMDPEQLDPAVTGRVPVFISRDNRYFQDTFQAMPAEGFTAMFRNMVTRPGIELALDTEFFSLPKDAATRVIFTGPIDEYFDFAAGVLPYRSLRFDFRTERQENFQPVGTVNYPNEADYTRITEAKYLSGQTAPVTTLIYEYPQAYQRGVNLPYYPIPCPNTERLLDPYLDRAQKLKGKVWFGGRLGDYSYYNMDQACASALSLYEKDLSPLIRQTAM